MIYMLLKSMLLILRYHVDQLLKHCIIWATKVLRKRLSMLTKRYLMLVKKTDLNKEVAVIENKIISVTRLTTTASLNTRATEIENQIADITNLATKAALNTKVTEVESKIVKYLTLIIQVPRLLSIQRSQKIKRKYLVSQLLLLPLNLVDQEK